MNVVVITDSNKEKVLDQAVEVIKGGGVVVTPSETQYGLSVDPINEKAVAKVYAIKGKSLSKPLGLIVGSIEIIRNNFLTNAAEEALMSSFWPGPLGLRLQIRDLEQIKRISELTLGETQYPNRMVVRISSDDILQGLSNKLGRPIVSTSANVSGQPGCYDVESVIKQLENQDVQPDLIIDAGPLPESPPSTMIDATEESYQVIREGADWKQVKKLLEQ